MPVLRDDHLEMPHPHRFDPSHPNFAAARTAHANALLEGRPGYADPATGAFVFTAAALAEQGTCCESGCRHCPWL